MEESREAIERARKIAAGPLGQQTNRFPLMFAAPLFLGKRLNPSMEPEGNNGTASLVDFGTGPMVVTAQHVIEHYRKLLDTTSEQDLTFQIGNLKFKKPLNRVISESKNRDLATLKLEPNEIPKISEQEEEIGRRTYIPHSWPIETVKEKEWVIFGGFPRKGRDFLAPAHVRFDTYSGGPTDVTSVSEESFVCQFQRENWIVRDPYKRGDLNDLGGLSGCPVFRIREKSITIFDLVGFVFEFSQGFDLLYVRHAHFISREGEIH